MKTSLLFSIVAIAFLFTGCSETIDNTGTCSDGILNQGEQQVDCGGPCLKRCESCADGIMNQGETAVDCGGPCDPCYPRLSATIDSASWWSTSRSAILTGPSGIQILGTDGLRTITLQYQGPFTAGSVGTGAAFSGQLTDEFGVTFTSAGSGKIIFTTFDTLQHVVSGTFKFNALNNVTGDTIEVQAGVFTQVAW